MTLRSPSRQTLVPQVIEQLRTQIATGEWPVGSRIPTEPDLVAALGVGRNTVREAVRALVHAGVLECRQGSGTYVTATHELTGVVARRLAAHGAGKASRYTRTRLPVELVYCEPARSRGKALRRESAIKSLPRSAKIQLIRMSA